MITKDEAPEVLRVGLLNMQVCVPAEWTDDEAQDFANQECICGTSHGWQMRKEGSRLLRDDPERQPCAERKGYVHIMFDC